MKSSTYFKVLKDMNWWPVVLLVGFMSAVLVGGLYLFKVSSTTPSPPPTAQPAKRRDVPLVPMLPPSPLGQDGINLAGPEQAVSSTSSEEPKATEIVRQINEARLASGVPRIAEDPLLGQSASLKATDMITRNYWSHSAPDGSGPWASLKRVGYPYTYVGENLAYGQYDSSNPEGQIVQNWLKSRGHRKNMLNPHFKDLGVSIQKAQSYNGHQNVYLIVTQYGSKR